MFVLKRRNINHNQRRDSFRKLHCKMYCSFTHRTVNSKKWFFAVNCRPKRKPHLPIFPDNTIEAARGDHYDSVRPTYRPESFFRTAVQNYANFCLNKIIHAVLPYPGQNFQLDQSIALMPSDRTGGSYFISNSLQKIDQRRGNFLRPHNITIRQIAQSNLSTSF